MEFMKGEDVTVDTSTKELKGLPTPQEMYAHLNKFVIGQDGAKKQFVQHNHYKRINKPKDALFTKSNIVVVGPTGSGKTYCSNDCQVFGCSVCNC